MNWKIIKTEKEYHKAMVRLDDIFDSTKGDVSFDEAELLVMLIEKYESETEPSFKNPDPIDILKYKMEVNNMRNKDLALMVGGKSKVSELLNRKRKLTLSMIRKLNKELRIPAELLIGDYELSK